MANTIKHKRGTTVPVAGDLVTGELAINTATGTVYTKKDDGTVVAISGGGGGSSLPLSGGTMTGPIVFDGTSGQYISKGNFDTSRGGNYGISLVCSIGYEFNWQAGWLTTTEQYSVTPRPLYLDSLAGTTLRVWDSATSKGTEVSHENIVINSDATYDIELAGWGLGVQQSADHTKGTTIEYNGLHAYDGASHLYVNPTGITFPDSTVQTTATLVGPAGTNGTNGTVWNYRGAYDNGVVYAANDYVDLDGSSYVMINTVGGGGYGPISHPANWQLVAHKGDTGATGNSGSNGNDGGSFPDANNDNIPYIRYNQSWQPLSNYDQTGGGGGGIGDAPQDGYAYVRYNGSWVYFSTFDQNTDAQVYSDNILTNILSVNYSTYYIVTADSNRIVQLNGGCVIYLGTDCPVGTQLVFVQQDSNNTTFYGQNGATLRANGNKYRTNGQYAVCTAIKTDTYTWYLAGDIIV